MADYNINIEELYEKDEDDVYSLIELCVAMLRYKNEVSICYPDLTKGELEDLSLPHNDDTINLYIYCTSSGEVYGNYEKARKAVKGDVTALTVKKIII